MDGQKFLSSALLPFLLPLMTGCLTERLQVIASLSRFQFCFDHRRQHGDLLLLVDAARLAFWSPSAFWAARSADISFMNNFKMPMASAAVRKEWKLRGTIVIRNLRGTHGNLADGRAHLPLEETTPTDTSSSATIARVRASRLAARSELSTSEAQATLL